MLKTRETLYNDRWYHVETQSRNTDWQYAVWGAFLISAMAAVLLVGLGAVK